MVTFFSQVYPNSAVQNVYKYEAFLLIIVYTHEMVQCILVRESFIDWLIDLNEMFVLFLRNCWKTFSWWTQVQWYWLNQFTYCRRGMRIDVVSAVIACADRGKLGSAHALLMYSLLKNIVLSFS
jgi:hypothetical protein